MDLIEKLHQVSYEILTEPISEMHCFIAGSVRACTTSFLAFDTTIWAEDSLNLSWQKRIFTPLVCFACGRQLEQHMAMPLVIVAYEEYWADGVNLANTHL